MAEGVRLALFGAPGAGKGTQAQLLVERFGVPHISSGDLFRHHLREETPLGLRAAEYMRQGVLVPDELTIDIMLERVMAIHKDDGFILDGFPRNRNQAEVLDEALERRSRALDKVVYIEVSEQELVRRLAGRFSCRECQAPHSLPQDSSAGGSESTPEPSANAAVRTLWRGAIPEGGRPARSGAEAHRGLPIGNAARAGLLPGTGSLGGRRRLRLR